jgi:hypothetical protein
LIPDVGDARKRMSGSRIFVNEGKTKKEKIDASQRCKFL